MESSSLVEKSATPTYYENCPGCRIGRVREKQIHVPFKLFSYIWIVSLCSALPVSSLFPFIYFMVRDFHIAKVEEDIGIYVGFMGSSFMVGRALTSVFWGLIADRYGRKPVILIGTFSVVIFNALFGLSSTFWMGMFMRFLLGSFNGLPGTIRAYASEVSSDENQALALSVVSTSRGIGMIIGPGSSHWRVFSQPAESFPNIFSSSSLFGRFPYLLPCLLISLYAAGAFILCFWLPIFSFWAVSDRKFGGLSYSSKDVGIVLAISGGGLLVFQLLLYPPVEKIFGPLAVTRLSAVVSIPLLWSYPYIAMLSGVTLNVVLNFASLTRNVLSVSLVTGLFILLNNAIPQHQRGAANGFSLTAMSVTKALGPAGAGAIFSWAQKRQVAWFFPGDQMVFFLLNVITFVGLLFTFKPFLAQPQA